MPTSGVTQILEAMKDGDHRAADRLLMTVYTELRRLAEQRLRHEPAGQTLQATALVHEAYLRLLGNEDASWENRSHFFGAAAEAMRRILVERARRKGRLRHGGGRKRQPLSDVDGAIDPDATDLVVLDEALERFAAEDPKKAELVKLRFFAGLSGEQAADVLGISRATAERHWAFARAWLYREVKKSEG